jgi:hypothetical protein
MISCKIKIIALLNKEKSHCENVIDNYDGDCDDDHQRFRYCCRKVNYINKLIKYIEQEN